MIDDQDRCEWVNVSSGTGSPGQSQTKGYKTAALVAPKSAQFACEVNGQMSK